MSDYDTKRATVSDYDTKRAARYLPQVAVATTAVAVMPVAVVWWLRSSGAITSAWTGVLLAITVSLLASLVGSAYWKRRRGPRDLLFGELLIWGWLRRLRMERRLAKSLEALRTHEELRGDGHSPEEKFGILTRLAVALEAQDAYTDGHSRRVAAHTVIVARRMGLTSGEVSRLRAAAAIHDIGKVRVPLDVLDKPGMLTSAEFELVKRHADEGAEIVACLGDPELTAIVRHHHERFDGTGYPSGLAGERIPLGARIIAVADTFDAITSVRPYRPAASHKEALEALVEASGTQLDPAVVRAFLRSYSGNKAIVFWSLLTVSPQQAVAWLRVRRPAPTNVLLSWMAATVAAITTIALIAVTAPIGPRPGASGGREAHENTPRAIVAAPLRSAVFVPARSAHRVTARLRGRAGQGVAQGSLASRTAARTPASSRSVPSHGAGTRSGGGSSGGPRLTHTGRLGGVRAGRSTGNTGSGPAGGSTGGPVGGSGGGSTYGTGGAPGVGSSGGSSGGSAGGPSPGPAGGPSPEPAGGSSPGSAGGSRPGPAGGSSPGSAGGSRPGPAGGSSPGSAGGSRPGSAGGSSGSSGVPGSPGGTGAGRPSSKDQCKNGGYAQFGFANQGQCVASVEPGSP